MPGYQRMNCLEGPGLPDLSRTALIRTGMQMKPDVTVFINTDFLSCTPSWWLAKSLRSFKWSKAGFKTLLGSWIRKWYIRFCTIPQGSLIFSLLIIKYIITTNWTLSWLEVPFSNCCLPYVDCMHLLMLGPCNWNFTLFRFLSYVLD